MGSDDKHEPAEEKEATVGPGERSTALKSHVRRLYQAIGEILPPRLGSIGLGVGWGLDLDNIFWGAASLTLLGVLIGLLILMLTEDVHRAMAQRGPRSL